MSVSNLAKVEMSKMSKMVHYDVQLVAGTTQQINRRVAYVHFAADSDHPGLVPNSINALAVRAKQGECTRLRCMERCCPLRPEDERARLAEVPEGEDPRGRDRGRNGGFGIGQPGCIPSARVGA